MTYNVFGGTLNLALSIHEAPKAPTTDLVPWWCPCSTQR